MIKLPIITFFTSLIGATCAPLFLSNQMALHAVSKAYTPSENDFTEYMVSAADFKPYMNPVLYNGSYYIDTSSNSVDSMRAFLTSKRGYNFNYSPDYGFYETVTFALSNENDYNRIAAALTGDLHPGAHISDNGNECEIPFSLNDSRGWLTLSISDYMYFVKDGWDEDSWSIGLGPGADGIDTTNMTSIPFSQVTLRLFTGNKLEDGATKTISLNVEDKLTEDQIVSSINAYDMFGAPATLEVVESNYRVGAVGNFTIKVRAKDNYGQTANGTLSISVFDTTLPALKLLGDLVFKNNEEITAGKLRDMFEASDNVALSGDISFSSSPYDITPLNKSFSASDPDTASWGKLPFGNYTLTASQSDSSGNIFDLNCSLKIEDGVAPVLRAKNGGDINSNITFGSSFIDDRTVDYLKGQFEAIDDIDGVVEVSITFDKPLSKTPDDYPFTISARDKSGNVTSVEKIAVVYADLPPYFVIDPNLYIVKNTSQLTNADFVQAALFAQGLTSQEVSICAVDDSAYFKNWQIPGTYTISYRLVLSDKSTINDTFKVQVIKSDNSGGDSPTIDGKIDLGAIFNKLINNPSSLTAPEIWTLAGLGVAVVALLSLVILIFHSVRKKKKKK